MNYKNAAQTLVQPDCSGFFRCKIFVKSFDQYWNETDPEYGINQSLISTMADAFLAQWLGHRSEALVRDFDWYVAQIQYSKQGPQSLTKNGVESSVNKR